VRVLLDANIFLEVLLAQERKEDVKRLLVADTSIDFFITDFSLHAIGVVLFRNKRNLDLFDRFVIDMLSNYGIEILSMATGEMSLLSEIAGKFNLDFDDAYQYAIAKKHGLTLVSFDSDFDRTDQKRKTPAELLK
jgi:predicted nucleic acid-binding protein